MHDKIYEGSKEIGAIAHLYRAEIYRSTVWRQRLDITTNWAVVTTGIALSVAFASSESSALPLALVGLLVAVFLNLEARRYRYFSVWRFRARILEIAFYVPMLRGEGAHIPQNKGQALSDDYENPQFHIGFWRAVGRRLRRNYAWIFLIQIAAYVGKLSIHPTPLTSMAELYERASVGPLPGQYAIIAGIIFHSTWIVIGLATWRLEGTDQGRISEALMPPDEFFRLSNGDENAEPISEQARP